MKPSLENFDYFYNQFFITDQNHTKPSSWLEQAVNNWRVIHHPSVPVQKCLRTDGLLVGCLIGWAISEDGRLLLADEEEVEPLVVPGDDDVNIERFIYSYGGRFCVFVNVSDNQRLYMDPYGSLAVVFSKKDRIAGSTPTLIERVTNSCIDRSVNDSPPKHLYFPAGLTINDDISRVVANHFLDLNGWVVKRHWPIGSFDWMNGAGDCEDMADRIAGRLRKNIKAVTGNTNAYVGLTAGRDSRVQLACCRDVLDKLIFYTTYEDETSIGGQRDLHVARKIARDNDLKYIEVPYDEQKRPLLDYEKRRYLETIGYSGNWGFQHFNRACAKYLDLNNALLMGFGGEVTRAYFWKASESLNRKWNPTELLDRLSLPYNKRFMESVETWLASLGDIDPVLALELFYLENRVSSWACPHLYGCAQFRFILIPFSHREIVECSYKLPVEHRKDLRVEKLVMQNYWPKLSEYPFQSFIGRKRLSHGLKRRLQVLSRKM